eukprot:1447119-Pyramimonas_sp.AAC.1
MGDSWRSTDETVGRSFRIPRSSYRQTYLTTVAVRAGTYLEGAESASRVCTPCPAGTYKDVRSDARKCTPCPPHSELYSAGATSARECVCLPGFVPTLPEEGEDDEPLSDEGR